MIFFTAGKKITGFQEFSLNENIPDNIFTTNDIDLADLLKDVVGYAYLDDNNQLPANFYETAIIKKNEAQALEAFNNKLLEVKSSADRHANSLVWEVPDVEKETWASQEAEARAWLLDSETPTPVIDVICAQRQCEKSWLVDKVILKADYYRSRAAEITAKRQRIEDELKTAYALKDDYTDQANQLAELQHAINQVQAINTEIDFVI